jgi:hypothetical protein
MNTISLTTRYAMLQLELIGKECGFKPHQNNGKVHIEFANGKNITISDEEKRYQAEEYLKSQIEMLNF